MLTFDRKTLTKKTIHLLKIIYGTAHVDYMLHRYGKKALFHRSLLDYEAPKGRAYMFKAGANLVLDSYLMNAKSISLQKKVNQFITARYSIATQDETTCPSPHNISFYNGFFSGKDSSPKIRLVKIHKHHRTFKVHKSIWIDKYNHKPTYDLLNAVKKDLHRQLRKYKNVEIIIGRIENPHHTSKLLHIYSHGHYHYLLMIDNPYPELILKIKLLIRKDFIKEFGYSPTHNNLEPLYYYDYNVQGNGGVADINSLQPLVNLKFNTGIIKKIPVSLTFNPKQVVVHAPESFIHNNLAFQHHSKDIKHVGYGKLKINTNLLALIAVDYYVEYISQDYRLQTKDSDDFLENKKLSRNQKKITFCADINSGGSKSIINSISKSRIQKETCIGLNRAIQAQQRQLEFHLQINHECKQLVPVATFATDLKRLKVKFKQKLFKSNQNKLERTSYQNQILNLIVYRTLLAELTTDRTYINEFGFDKSIFNLSSLFLLSDVETLDLFRQKPT